MALENFFKRTFMFLIMLVFMAGASFAQGSATLRGTVTDEITGEGLPGANIVIRGTSVGVATDLDGNFVLRNVPAGTQIVIASYIGYMADSARIQVSAGANLNQNFALRVTALVGEEVVVTAQAQGQKAAIQQQLSSDKISNIVSEQRIQQLPDFNAAQAISRLPGISTTQSSGEDNKVVIRGLSPKYNSIAIEGVNLSATGSTQIGLSSNPDIMQQNLSNDRSVDLTSISPYMIRMIAVYKSLTPDMNANSIGGTVNMELREAPEDFHWNLMYQQGYTAKSNTYGNYRAVASASNRFFDSKLGLYGLVNAESYDRNSDNMDANYNIAAEQSAIDPTTGYRPVKVSTVTFNRHIETRKRYGGNLIMDYAIPNGSLKFINLFARINSDYTEHRQTINYDQGVMQWQLRIAENITDTRMHSLKLDYDLGFITADISANFTSSDNSLEDSPQINFNQTDALQSGVPRDNKTPDQLTYLLTSFKGNDEVILRSANLFTSKYKEEKWVYKADFEIPYTFFDSDVNGFFKFGGQFNNQTNSTDQETPYLAFNGNANGTGTDIQTNLMKEIKSRYGIGTNTRGELIGSSFLNSDGDLYKSFLDNKYGSVYYSSNPGILNDILDYVIGNPAFDASNRDFSTGAQGGWYNGPYQALANDYNYKEKYYAGYGMAKINFMDFMIIGGARYERVETDYFAYNARDQRNPQTQVMYDTTSVTSNDFILPMGQVKYSPFDWMDVRYAYTQTLSRPDYQQISPRFSITQSNQIFTGNPELKPAQAFSHDFNVSFYSNSLGLLTVGGFYKTIENFVYNAQYQLDAAEGAGVDALARYQIVRDGQYVVTPTLTNGKSNATVYRPLNNPFDATVKGLELDFQHNFWYLPAPFSNIVLGLNYARIWSDTKYPFYDVRVVTIGRDRIAQLIDSSSSGRLIDQPNHVFNSYIGYDYEGFSTRLSFVYQDNVATGNGGRYPENDSYNKDYFRVDFSARQLLPWYGIELFLDAQNLNNANSSGIQKSTGGFRNIQNYGLTANLGVRLKY